MDDIRHQRTIHAVLKAQVNQFGNRAFLYWQDRVYGFEDLDRHSDQVALGLQSLGIEKGDKVGIMLGNCPEFLFSWFATSKLGAVEVPVNTAHRGELLSYMVGQSDCRVLIIGAQFLDRIARVLDHLPDLEQVVVVHDTQAPLAEISRPSMDFLELQDNDGAYDAPEVVWSDPFAIMFTSGTTGPSKGALMPHNYALHMGDIMSEACEYDTNDVLYNALPLFHGNAQLLSTMPALMSGAKMVLAPKFSASRFWDDIRQYQCTEFNYIGAVLPILLKADPKPDDADNPLRIMMGAGAPMDLFDTIEKRFGVTLVEGYGMSEIGTPLMNTLKERKPGTCGKPFRDYQVRLVDDHGIEVGDNMPGELLMRPLTPYTMVLEYYKMPEKTVEAWGDLWFHTGDYLSRDQEGYFHFLDRKKDALRRRGENISSYEVERAVNTHPKVLECAAVAVTSDLGEDEVMVCVALQPEQDLAPVDLIRHCEERMAYFMVPRYLRFMPEIPKTPTQKAKKYQLRQEGVTRDTWDREAAGYQLKR